MLARSEELHACPGRRVSARSCTRSGAAKGERARPTSNTARGAGEAGETNSQTNSEANSEANIETNIDNFHEANIEKCRSTFREVYILMCIWVHGFIQR